MMIVTVLVWVSLLIGGFALVVWTGLGSAIVSPQGETPTDFMTALYYSGYSFTTLGTGDFVPMTGFFRLITILEAALGFSTFTVTLTYLLSVYNSIIQRNTFALSLHHQTNSTANAAELLARLSLSYGIDNIHQEVAEIARDLMHLLEAQHSYPVLLYFRFRKAYYSLPRILYLAMDMATLIRSALSPSQERSLIHSAAVGELWGGSLQLLNEISDNLLPTQKNKLPQSEHEIWRSHYFQALETLKSAGVDVVDDPEAGADYYLGLRRQWSDHLVTLTQYLGYDWDHIAVSESNRRDSIRYPQAADSWNAR